MGWLTMSERDLERIETLTESFTIGREYRYPARYSRPIINPQVHFNETGADIALPTETEIAGALDEGGR
jgi:hypothetical protein